MGEVHASADVDIAADAETVWELITDFEDYPSWSKIHKHVEVVSHNDEGWPELVRMKMSLVGISDTQLIRHTWTEDSVSWELAEPTKVQRAQRGTYTVTPTDQGCHAQLDGMIDLVIPLPSMVIRQGQKIALGIATRAVRERAEAMQRDRDGDDGR